MTWSFVCKSPGLGFRLGAGACKGLSVLRFVFVYFRWSFVQTARGVCVCMYVCVCVCEREREREREKDSMS